MPNTPFFLEIHQIILSSLQLFCIEVCIQVHKNVNSNCTLGTSLVVQWLGPHAPKGGGPGSIPRQGTRSHMHVATESLHVTTKESACRNQDRVQPNK